MSASAAAPDGGGTPAPVPVTGPRQADRGARVSFIPPPLYYVAAFAAGLLADRKIAALPVGGRPASELVGAAVAVGGAALMGTGAATVLRHRTTIVPHHPVSTLVTTGVYRRTRNPMYTGLAIGYVGGILLVGSWWPVLTLPAALLAVRKLVIDPEERYLTGKFGQAYTDYQARVRRWL